MKKHYLILIVLLVIVGGLGAAAVYKYEHRTVGMTVQKALNQRDAALLDLKISKALDATHQQGLANLQSQVNDLSGQKATLCAQIKKARLVQPLCQ